MKRSGSVTTAIAVLAIGTGLILSMRPWHAYHDQKDDTVRQVQQMKASKNERAELLKEEARAKSSIGREEMARKLGYVWPGEKPADHP
jgi:hypothetical protein